MSRPVILLVALCLPVQLAADDATWETREGDYRVSYESELDPVVINRIHSWTLTVTDDAGTPVEGAAISVEGGMPAHDHGLPTAPRITRELAPGRYLLEGLRFHMTGAWQIVVTIEADGVNDSAVILLDL